MDAKTFYPATYNPGLRLDHFIERCSTTTGDSQQTAFICSSSEDANDDEDGIRGKASDSNEIYNT